MFIFFLLFSIILNLNTKPFANSFIEFQLPDSWDCKLTSGDDWYCQTINPKQKPEAIVVLTYRTQKQDDTMANYFQILNNSLEISDLKGHKSISKAQYTQYKNILGQDWVDSQHESSELPGFITRYLATVKNGRSVLITLTIYKNKMSFYMPQLYKMIESLRLRMSLPPAMGNSGVAGLLGQNIAAIKGKKNTGSQKLPTLDVPEGSKDNSFMIAVGLGGFVALVTFIIIRKRKKKKKRGLFE